MEVQLDQADFAVIRESLQYSKRRIEDHDQHPSPEFKRQQVERIDSVIRKFRPLGPDSSVLHPSLTNDDVINPKP